MSQNASFLDTGKSQLLARLRSGTVSDFLNSALPAGLRLGGAFLQLVVTVLIGRTLGAEAAGIYFFWAALMMEAGQVATFGLDRIAVQSLPRVSGGREAESRFLGAIRTTTILISFALSALVIGYAVFTRGITELPVWWYFMIPACVGGVTMCMLNQEGTTALGRPILAVLYRHTIPTIIVLVGVLCLGSHMNPDAGLAIYAFAFFFTGFGALLGPGLFRLRPAFHWPGWFTFQVHMKKGAPIFLASLFAALALMFPLAILERTHPSDEVAWMTTAFRIFFLLDVLAKAIYSVILPDLSRAAERMDREILISIYRSSILKGLLLLGLPILGLYALAPWIMEMFGEGFAGGTPVLRALLLCGVVSLILGPAHHLLLMVGKTKSMAFFSGIYFATVGTLAWVFVPAYGAIALAVVLGIGLIVEKLLYLGCAIREGRKHPGGGKDE